MTFQMSLVTVKYIKKCTINNNGRLQVIHEIFISRKFSFPKTFRNERAFSAIKEMLRMKRVKNKSSDLYIVLQIKAPVRAHGIQAVYKRSSATSKHIQMRNAAFRIIL